MVSTGMKILITPYHLRKQFTVGKLSSGVDACMLKQADVLGKKHEVKVFFPYSNNPEFVSLKHDNSNYEKERKKILFMLQETIEEFAPDVVLSNTTFGPGVYNLFRGTKTIFVSHSIPGAIQDVSIIKHLESFLKEGNLIACNSEFHRQKFNTFYKKKESDISASLAFPSSFVSENHVARAPERLIVGISACNNTTKGTFIPCKLTEGTDINAEIFTTLNYIGGEKEAEYFEKNMNQYGESENVKVNVDCSRDTMFSRLENATCFFMGRANKETFCITAMESLERGVPVIIYGNPGNDAALDFVDKSLDAVRYVKNKAEFVAVFSEFEQKPITWRQDVADSCAETLSRSRFEKSLESAL